MPRTGHPKFLKLAKSCVTDRTQLAEKSSGLMGGTFRKPYGTEKKKAPSGPSSMGMVNDGNIGWQQPVHNRLTSQSWPNYGRTQFDQPDYGFQPNYGPYQHMSWNPPMYGQLPYYQPYKPYMYGKK